MWSAIQGIFGIVANPFAEVVKELIDTPLEKAQAQVAKLHAIDPNGQMRRDIGKTVTSLYRLYIMVAMFLLLAQAFGLGDPVQVAKAIDSVVDLFLPITGMFTAIVSASFGVSVSNNWKDIKLKGEVNNG